MTRIREDKEATTLVVVDVQNDFCPGGNLGVPDGDQVVPLINHLAKAYDHVLLTQDWHPADHRSFASAHPGRQPFETVEVAYGAQTLWPDHCIQNTPGAAFHPNLDLPQAELIIRKGFRREIDSYSAFFENDHQTSTGLGGYLRSRGLRQLDFCGLATDFCVNFSAVDAAREGFTVRVIEDACRAIDLDGSLAAAKQGMQAAGVGLIESKVVLGSI